MQIKINENILSIPPFISTSWTYVTALQMKEGSLVITLTDGSCVSLANLSEDVIKMLFNYHALYLETKNSNNSSLTAPAQKKDPFSGLLDQMGEPSIRFAFGNLDGEVGSFMHHNASHAHMPDLPAELLNKITSIAKLMLPLDEAVMLKSEPNCNCFHCQIARALYPSPSASESIEQLEEEVKDEELNFQQWTIHQIGEQLFSVTNRLDEHEKYNVYLGQPVGCTCGKQGCEHIIAVLKS